MPISAPSTGLDECLFFISLVSDILAVLFSVSFGCARRSSVFIHATLLVPYGTLFASILLKAVEENGNSIVNCDV